MQFHGWREYLPHRRVLVGKRRKTKIERTRGHALSGFVAIDWGSTNFRAYRVDAIGGVIDRLESPLSIATMSKDEIRDTVDGVVDRWPNESESLYCCGMVGSSVGWQEVPYVDCPTRPQELVAKVPTIEIGANKLHISPGLACISTFGVPDVMRGEELQYLGVLSLNRQLQIKLGLVCMPGTHTKWMPLDRGAVASFSTSMVGDIYNAVSKNGLLRNHIQNEARQSSAFLDGVNYGRKGGALSRLLFSVRSRVVTAELPNADAASYASGIMIGNDVADALEAYAKFAEDCPIVLVGEPELCGLYKLAIETCGGTAVVFDAEDACVQGFHVIRSARGGAT